MIVQYIIYPPGELEYLPLAVLRAAEKPFKGVLRQQAQPQHIAVITKSCDHNCAK